MHRTILAVFLVMLLSAPAASAGWNPFSAAIELPPHHVGDQYRYTQDVVETVTLTEEGQAAGWRSDVAITGRSVLVIDVEGPTLITNAYGTPTPAQSYRIRQADDETLLRDERCHMIRDGGVALRRDFETSPPRYDLRSAAGAQVGAVWSQEVSKTWTPQSSFWANPCDGHDIWAGQKHREGSVIHLWSPTLAPGTPLFVGWAPSEPAVATTFHGRDALLFTWPASSIFRSGEATGVMSVVLADGVAPIARVEVDLTHTDPMRTRTLKAVTELVGLSAGVSQPMQHGGNAQPLQENTLDARIAFDPRMPDLSAFDLPYPLEDAIAAVRAEASLETARWLATRPEAVLAAAIYERDLKDPAVGWDVSTLQPQKTDGGWWLMFSDGETSRTVITVRLDGVETPLGALQSPAKVHRHHEFTSNRMMLPETMPADVVDSAGLVRLSTLEGIRPQDVESLAYFMGPLGWNGQAYANVFVSTAAYMLHMTGEDSGRTVALSLVGGNVWDVSTTDRRHTASGLLAEAGGMGGAGSLAASSAPLAGVGTGMGLAAGAATGVGLLFVLAKFVLAPFYTRLVRTRLLDNPLRARLYERVRQEPGIHRAELVTAFGLGEGATRHHLDQLVAHEFLVEMRIDGLARYYAAGAVPPAQARTAAVLRSAPARAVYDLYCERPQLTLREAGARLGMSAPSVHRHKKKLEKEGLLPAPQVALVR